MDLRSLRPHVVHPFGRVAGVGIEEQFEQLRRSAACAHLSRDQVSELIAIGATLVEERRRIRRVLERLPEHFIEVRELLNELARTVR